MKTYRFIFLILLFEAVTYKSTTAQAHDPNGYQKAKWGMSMEKVKSLFDKEWEDPVEVNGEQTILFRDVFNGNPFSVSFIFFNDKLYWVIFAIHPDDDSPDMIRTVFYQMGKILRAKYGKPHDSGVAYFPVETGQDTWQFKNTRIELGYMPTSSLGSGIQVRYYSKDLEKVRNRKQLQKEKDNF
jgi:hypothetical protein